MNNSYVMKIEYETLVGGVIKQKMVALFDSRDYKESLVRKIIQSYDSYPKIIMILKDDFENVFRSMNPNLN